MDYKDTYPHRDMRFFKDESQGDHAKRMRKAELYGRIETSKPFTLVMAELLVAKDATKFAALLQKLGMRFKTMKGIGKDSFRIEA